MADERNEDERIAPVALPAGSFELKDLRDSLEKAVSVKDREQHPERINKAIAETVSMPEILAAADSQAVPLGAELVDTEIVYADGQDPVTRKTPVFQGVEAEDGEAAAKMRYDPHAGGEPTAEPTGTPPATEDTTTTLSEQAAATVEETEDAGSSRSGAKGK